MHRQDTLPRYTQKTPAFTLCGRSALPTTIGSAPHHLTKLDDPKWTEMDRKIRVEKRPNPTRTNSEQLREPASLLVRDSYKPSLQLQTVSHLRHNS